MAFWGRVARSTAPAAGGLGVLRILTGLLLLLVLAPYSQWLGEVPQTLFAPPRLSFMNLLPGFPPSYVMAAADATALTLAGMILLGVYARAATLAFVVVGVFMSNAVMCFGKIDHDGMLWAYLGCMAFSGWGQTLALRPDKPGRPESPARAMALLGVCIGFGMSAVGLHKAFGWVDFDTQTSGVLGWAVYGYFVDGRHDLLAPYLYQLSPWHLELVDYAGVLFETSCFVALLLGSLSWRLWLLSACLFHLINTLVLNIPFLQHLPVYLAFVDFTQAQARLQGWWERRGVRVAFAAFGVGCVLVHLTLRWFGVGRWLLFVLDEVRNYGAVLRVCSVCWVLIALVMIDDIVQRRARFAPPSPVTVDQAPR
jgi:hypothetical protein